MQFTYNWPIDRTLSGATTTAQSWSGSDDIEEIFRILQAPALLEPHYQIV